MDKLNVFQKKSLSHFNKHCFNRLNTTKALRIMLKKSKNIINECHMNLNNNYRYGSIPRFIYNTNMKVIEEVNQNIEKIENKKLLLEFNENELMVQDVLQIKKKILYSCCHTKLSTTLKLLQQTSIIEHKSFKKTIKELTFLDDYLNVINMATDTQNTVPDKPLFIDINGIVGQTAFDEMFSLFIILPIRSSEIIRIRIHLRRDNLNNLKFHPYFKEKYNSLLESCRLVTRNDDLIKTFVEDYISEKIFLTKSVAQIRTKLYDCMRLMKDLKTIEKTKLITNFNEKTLIDKAKMLSIILLFSTKTYNYINVAWSLYNMYIQNEDEYSQCNPRKPDIWDILPWKAQKRLRGIRKEILHNSDDASETNSKKDMTIEEKIGLMNITDDIKKIAYSKLQEANSRNSDSNSTKASSWLEAFVQIPFGIYKKEEFIQKFQSMQNEITTIQNSNTPVYYMTIKRLMINISKFMIYWDNQNNTINKKLISKKFNVKQLKDIIYLIHPERKLKVKEMKKTNLINIIESYLIDSEINDDNNTNINRNINNHFIIDPKYRLKSFQILWNNLMNNISHDENIIPRNMSDINNCVNIWNRWDDLQKEQKIYVENVKKSLDSSIYGHDNAKKQIERIVCQWMTGKQNGYVFGFEGPPGVGKTTLAKYGLANALKDKNGDCRPFHFIAIGGGSNGSMLEGHSYTYVGSQYGAICESLIKSKCMNPIIFFDELDKVSSTNHGREIIGILTHLTDTTQNSAFRDKYFQGIELDLSKVLIIFSYNDPNSIDPILLDRIHRIQFKELTLNDKIIVVEDYLIPSICKEIGLEKDSIICDEETIIFVIENYTMEPGVRKLKQILYDIYREINVLMLNGRIDLNNLPYRITKEFLTDNILKKYTRIYPLIIKNKSNIGMIYGMYATRAGYGGLLPIECTYVYHNTAFNLSMTGSLQNVMTESMTIAKNIALDLLNDNETEKIMENMKDEHNMMKGIHIHCPEGAVQKDGPSAGMAITLCLYSLFTNKKIPENYSFTGEIRMNGEILRVGGISSKIMGALRSGIEHILIPKENKKDYERLIEECKTLKEHNIHYIEHINEAIKLLWNSPPTPKNKKFIRDINDSFEVSPHIKPSEMPINKFPRNINI
jgi:ATP-dependent Lon protease